MALKLSARSEQLLGTTVEIQVPAAHERVLPNCFAELGRIERAYSRFRDESELSRMNAHLGQWHRASDEMLFLLSKAEEFRKKTRGNFDITLKSSLDALGYDKNYSFKQEPGRKNGAGLLHNLKSIFSERIRIDAQKKQVLLNSEIDFGGFGKGFALDRVRELLELGGITHYCINAGGDIFARRGKGGAGDWDAWKIILEHPDDAERAIGTIALDNRALAGSSSNRRKWGEAGEYHHLLNAKTGKPAAGVKAIFVTAASGIEADAYATAIFTAGFDDGIKLSAHLPVEILLISSSNKMFQSPQFGAELFG
jgi:thiamine biosynthesis lipoprotein